MSQDKLGSHPARQAAALQTIDAIQLVIALLGLAADWTQYRLQTVDAIQPVISPLYAETAPI
ncbi:MAG: hypothetical protein NZ585_05185 [Chloracidobacterium sp.]|nr:hypothetical protein [Chloracidobacterium sp.]MDW8216846.1 hypothetical protein [Acidobacteriota bacterium]